MNCLAFLAVIHGSRGLYFYTFPAITADRRGREDFRRVAVTVPGSRNSLWEEVYDQGRALAVDSSLHLDFQPLEVKVLQKSTR